MNQPVGGTAAPFEAGRFEQRYRDERTAHSLPVATPWDIGGPQPVVQQLVALGAVKGEVLDPGTGPGHHAIYYASKGLSATGIDASPTAIERARQNARKARVSVNFQLADATKLDGLKDRFDTVVDCAFYHTFSIFGSDRQLQNSYVRALHRATKPGARLFMFEFGAHNVNGFSMPRSLSEDDFRRVLPAGGWEITYLGPTTYQVNVSVESFEMMAERNPDMADLINPMLERFRVIEPWLVDGRGHAPFWEVHATRIG
jgi:SAM-dependent methyltransferase